MCIGIPMQVLSVEPGFAEVLGRGTVRRIGTRLIDSPKVGQWLLVFIDDAREIIDDVRAQEVNSTLDLLEQAFNEDEAEAHIGFTLPSTIHPSQYT